ncbi:hypothetical protein ACFX5U_17390 [Sphingobacterium sp. SG20118]|uniref:hypothetical protein n=1 Tax=Sphingobacterium TaxID=28453 RepID=UPI000571D416|nr:MULTISPECIES: hypothetical protein [Sphingobacterium]MDH5825509.1 hypothetical protein [Sphingobacterium faecium]
MKNTFKFAFLGLALTVAFASCGGAETKTNTTDDSTANLVDSTETAIDSTLTTVDSAAINVDTTVTK